MRDFAPGLAQGLGAQGPGILQLIARNQEEEQRREFIAAQNAIAQQFRGKQAGLERTAAQRRAETSAEPALRGAAVREREFEVRSPGMEADAARARLLLEAARKTVPAETEAAIAKAGETATLAREATTPEARGLRLRGRTADVEGKEAGTELRRAQTKQIEEAPTVEMRRRVFDLNSQILLRNIDAMVDDDDISQQQAFQMRMLMNPFPIFMQESAKIAGAAIPDAQKALMQRSLARTQEEMMERGQAALRDAIDRGDQTAMLQMSELMKPLQDPNLTPEGAIAAAQQVTKSLEDMMATRRKARQGKPARTGVMPGTPTGMPESEEITRTPQMSEFSEVTGDLAVDVAKHSMLAGVRDDVAARIGSYLKRKYPVTVGQEPTVLTDEDKKRLVEIANSAVGYRHRKKGPRHVWVESVGAVVPLPPAQQVAAQLKSLYGVDVAPYDLSIIEDEIDRAVSGDMLDESITDEAFFGKEGNPLPPLEESSSGPSPLTIARALAWRFRSRIDTFYEAQYRSLGRQGLADLAELYRTKGAPLRASQILREYQRRR